MKIHESPSRLNGVNFNIPSLFSTEFLSLKSETGSRPYEGVNITYQGVNGKQSRIDPVLQGTGEGPWGGIDPGSGGSRGHKERAMDSTSAI